nr:hypothetical protein [Tanacetum cinerariifolium]
MALNNAQTKTTSSAFRSMLEKHPLTGPNFNEWFRALTAGADAQALANWAVLFYRYNEVACVELQELVNMFHSCKQAEGQSISFILNSLSSKFQAFVQNYNMQSMEKTISEVHSLLIEFEKSIKRNKQPIVGASSTPQVMAIQGGRVQKYKPQGKAKRKGKGKGPQNSYPTKPQSLNLTRKSLMKKKKKTGGQNVASTSLGIYTIELFSFPKNFWVYDTGCGTHICNTKQRLRGAKKLKRGSLYLYVGNGVRAEVKAIESFDLVSLNGLIIVLDNCHYAPSITMSVVSVSRLVDKGFTLCFTNFGLSVSMNKMLYFNAITVNGIYKIDMRDFTLPIINSMYSISNKRTKSSLDSTYLWHCRLAHINKKRIEKLQHDGLLKFTDNELFDQCVSCISGKMTRKSFSHKTEKVKDVLGLIHTDVCGPLRHVLKKGASYFITFADDYSRYGYVYLLKHKHEVFEAFKVFKSEVENQLGKTIKAILSDRGGYPKETMGYYFYYPPENKIVVERYADFLEKDFILQKESGRNVELKDEDILPFENTSEHPIEEESLTPIVSQKEDVIPIRRSVRTHKALDRLYLNVEIDPDRLCFNFKVEEHSLGDLNEPVLPPNAKVVKSKWIYKKKTDMDGKVHIYKARLVAKGYTQTYGVDYEETFSPVADIRAIRILIAIAAYNDYEICKMDVKPREAAFILGIKIYKDRSRRLIGLSQNAYLDKILKRYRMDNSKRGSIPMPIDLHLSKSQCATTSSEMKCIQNVPYASAVGSIMYVHATEAEYIAASEAAKEAVWIRKFIDELDVVPSNDFPIKKNYDNSAAIIMAKESVIQKGARHFKRKYHYVRKCIKTGEIDIVKVHTYDNLVDLFTKALAGPKLT